MYLYRPVVIPGHSRKLLRPWIKPFYVCQKLSPIHVLLRRVCDGKLIANRVHINRLKFGILRNHGLDDQTPPDSIDATEPAILSDDELPPNSHMEDTPVDEHPVSTAVHDPAPDMAEPVAPTGPEPQASQLYEVEKILRKKYIGKECTYRVKWEGFDKSHSSWVSESDLTPQCKAYVQDMHDRSPTDLKSLRKR